MAVTITRTAWIDDDGSGTTGTVINNAAKTSLYNEIDGALAKVAQLTGGNNFTGTQAVTGAGTHTITGAGNTTLQVVNSSAGTGNYSAFNLGNDISPSLCAVQAFSSSFASASFNFANGVTLAAVGAGGLSVIVTQATASIRAYTNSLERLRLTATGDVLIGGTTAIGGAVGLQVSADATTRPPLIVQNLSASVGVNLESFVNSALGICGSIIQSTTTTVAYSTTSDARLKDDAGRATDLTALRTVVVHDFTWKADGVRDRGVFAQEAHALFPRAVSPGTDERTETGTLTQPWMTDYSKFVADLIVGWQQHEAEITELRALLARIG